MDEEERLGGTAKKVSSKPYTTRCGTSGWPRCFSMVVPRSQLFWNSRQVGRHRRKARRILADAFDTWEDTLVDTAASLEAVGALN